MLCPLALGVELGGIVAQSAGDTSGDVQIGCAKELLGGVGQKRLPFGWDRLLSTGTTSGRKSRRPPRTLAPGKLTKTELLILF
jgi:hypothetical protein